MILGIFIGIGLTLIVLIVAAIIAVHKINWSLY